MDHHNHEAHTGHGAGHTEPPPTPQPEDHSMHDMRAGHEGHAGHAMDSKAAHGEHAGHGVDHSGHELMFRSRFWVCLLLTVPVLLFSPMVQEWFGFSLPQFAGSEFIGPVFALAIFLYGGVPFIQMAIPEIRQRRPGMMLLISLAISVAFVYSVYAALFSMGGGFFWEMATLIDVMLVGHWLEMRSVRLASGALNELARLLPDTAERLDAQGETEEVPASALRRSDLVLVRPGASVPADGDVEGGQSSVNEAMITGESKPVGKNPGDRVIAGTINGDGSLRVRVTATGDETALAGIMRLVEEAQQSKSNTQLLADKAAGWLFYVALASAAITALAWIIAEGLNLDVLERVVTVLVIACPHALGLAIPLVVAISTALAANNGILVRDRLALEESRLLDTIIFDKTGTLTEGAFGVVGMATVSGWTEARALGLAAAIEGDSEHLIARGIRQKAEQQGADLPQVTNFEAIKGRGIKAQHQGGDVYVGGPRLLEMLSLSPDASLKTFADTAGYKGQSVVYLVAESQPVAAFALADVVREESRRAVDRLRALGVEVVMLTGDSKAVAAAVAEELGISHFYAEVLPDAKDGVVSDLQKQGKRVAMVGDGVNDAPALTRADVGVAIGSGTDVAIESADIILAQSNPLDVVKIFELSRATYRKMAQNLVWATAYNALAIPLAAGILTLFGIDFLLSPAIGALFMSLSTVIVAINAQLLRGTSLSAA